MYKTITLILLCIIIFIACDKNDEENQNNDIPQNTPQVENTSNNNPDKEINRQNEDDPCSLVSLEEIVKITGVNVKNVLPQGTTKVIGTCLYGGVDQPPLVQIGIVRGSTSKSGFDSNKSFEFEVYEGLGEEAIWVKYNRLLAVHTEDNYIFVRIVDASVGDKSTQQSMAKQIVELVLKKL